MTLENYGYLPELTDIRDFTIKDVKAELPQTLKFGEAIKLPSEVNNSRYCSPMHNQGAQGSCTAQSAVSLFEYMERKANNVHIDGSRAFVYFNTRQHAGFNTNQDTGSYILLLPKIHSRKSQFAMLPYLQLHQYQTTNRILL